MDLSRSLEKPASLFSCSGFMFAIKTPIIFGSQLRQEGKDTKELDEYLP